MGEEDFLVEVQTLFLDEALELLSRCETLFLQFEQSGATAESLKEILRLAHNLKGTSKSVGMDTISQFTHKWENVLIAVKEQRISLNPQVINLLLRCCDALVMGIKTLQSNLSAPLDFQSILLDLEQIESPAVQSPTPVQGEEQSTNIGHILIEQFAVNPAEVERAVRLQHSKLCEILVDEGTIAPEVAKLALEKQQQLHAGKGKKNEEFIRISADKIDRMLDYFGEQVILQSSLSYSKEALENNKDAILKIITQLNKITYDLQQTAISLRMVSMKSLFAKMERIIRDTSQSLHKQINFRKNGEDCELDKTIVEAITEPLTHMIRNAADHGIEVPAQRQARSKPEIGTITLSAFHHGGQFCLRIEDDGQGLDQEKLLAKALKAKLIQSLDDLKNEEQIFDLIFHNGLSTKDQATELSGRGVGMDVVKTTINSLKGNIKISSQKGKGTSFLITLPQTLAIFNGMVVLVGTENFVFPSGDIQEIIVLERDKIRRIDQTTAIYRHKEQLVQLIDLERFLVKGSGNASTIALLVSYQGHLYGLLVRDLIAQQRIVHKNLGPEVSQLPGVAGATILGSGHVALIISPAKIIEYFAQLTNKK